VTCKNGNAMLAAGRETEYLRHREGCATCDALGKDLDARTELAASLARPEWSLDLRTALYAIPSRTVSCEGADALLARMLEEPLPGADRARLDFHVGRCEACRESAQTLGVIPELVAPAAQPWLTGRLTASRRAPRAASPRTGLAWLLSPRGAIITAYAAAVIVMLSGFNPADLARGGEALARPLETGAQVAARSLSARVVDRLGAWQEDAARELAVLRGHATGYGRAAVANAFARFMKTEEPEETRPAPDESKDSEKQNQTQLRTWRA
jgi:hypothetical protein